MGQILQKWRVLGAVFIALTVVGGSYLLARSANLPSVAQASAETALLQAAAAKDSTGDGLPDWQKSLYGIPLDATTTDYFNLGMTDGEAVAKGLIVPKAVANDSTTATSTDQGTLTDSFSRAFFSLYLAAKQANGGQQLSADQQQALANQAFTNFIENFAPSANEKQLGDLVVKGSGSAALTAYAIAAEQVLDRYQSKTRLNEFAAVKGALIDGDAGAVAQVASVAKIYRQYASGLSVLPVPTELASADLELINSFFQSGTIYDGVAKTNSDPLLALVSLQQLTQSQTSSLKALADMGTAFQAAGISIPQGAPGSLFVRFAEKLISPQP